MSSGRKIKIPGFKPDKSGMRVERDLSRLSVSKRLQKQGKQKVRYGRKGGKR